MLRKEEQDEKLAFLGNNMNKKQRRAVDRFMIV